MIGRFKYDNETFYGEVKGNRVIVDRGLYNDTFLLIDLQLLPPVQPSKLICVGLNYKDHARELGMEIPEVPIFFLKPTSAVIGSFGKIVYPEMSKHVDYEGELAVIIGKRCKNISKEDAGSVIMDTHVSTTLPHGTFKRRMFNGHALRVLIHLLLLVLT